MALFGIKTRREAVLDEQTVIVTGVSNLFGVTPESVLDGSTGISIAREPDGVIIIDGIEDHAYDPARVAEVFGRSVIAAEPDVIILAAEGVHFE